MQKKFITNLFILLFLNLLVKPFWILRIEVEVQNAVGTSEFGFYYALLNFSFLLNILLDCGITNFNNKNIAQNNHLVTKHLSSIIVLRLLLAGIYLAVTLTAASFLGYDSKRMSVILVLAFNQVLISFILYLRSNIAGLHLFRTDSFISVLDRLIMIAICGFLLWGNVTKSPFKIEWYIYAQTVSYLITALITLVIVIDRSKLKGLNFHPAFFMMILKKSYPYAVLVLLMTFYNRIDTVMLERMLPDGDKQSGLYASAYRLLDSANMIAYLFAGLLLPMFARMIKHKQNVEHLCKLAFSLLVIPAIVVSVGSYFYSLDLMGLLYRNHVEESSQLFSVLMCCFVPISTTYIFGTLLTANGNLKELNFVALSGMVINITLNLIFIPFYKSHGSVISSLTTQTLTSLAQVLLVQNKFRFRFNIPLILKTVLFVIISCFGFYYSRLIPLSWGLEFICGIGFSFIIAFVLHLISIKGILNIVRYGE